MGVCFLNTKGLYLPTWIYDGVKARQENEDHEYTEVGGYNSDSQCGNPFNLRLADGWVIIRNNTYTPAGQVNTNYHIMWSNATSYPSSGIWANKTVTTFAFNKAIDLSKLAKITIPYNEFSLRFTNAGTYDIIVGISKTAPVSSTSSFAPTVAFGDYTKSNYDGTKESPSRIHTKTSTAAETISIPAGQIELDVSDIKGEYYIYINAYAYRSYVRSQGPIEIEKIICE